MGRVPEPVLGIRRAESLHLWMGVAQLAEDGSHVFSAQNLGFLPDPVHHGQAPSEQQSLAFCPECSPPRCRCPGRGSGRDH